MARSTVSLVMLADRALSIAARRRGLPAGSPPPRAATVISRISLVKSLPRRASSALLRFSMLGPRPTAVLLSEAQLQAADEAGIDREIAGVLDVDLDLAPADVDRGALQHLVVGIDRVLQVAVVIAEAGRLRRAVEVGDHADAVERRQAGIHHATECQRAAVEVFRIEQHDAAAQPGDDVGVTRAGVAGDQQPGVEL